MDIQKNIPTTSIIGALFQIIAELQLKVDQMSTKGSPPQLTQQEHKITEDIFEEFPLHNFQFGDKNKPQVEQV